MCKVKSASQRSPGKHRNGYREPFCEDYVFVKLGRDPHSFNLLDIHLRFRLDHQRKEDL